MCLRLTLLHCGDRAAFIPTRSLVETWATELKEDWLCLLDRRVNPKWALLLCFQIKGTNGLLD